MPSAAPELQAQWPGGDTEATAFLKEAGYRGNSDWTWTRPKPGHEPTERELSAICYLIDEWDYGGLRASIAIRVVPASPKTPHRSNANDAEDHTMLKKAILGWNSAPGTPKNWDPKRDGDCGALPIRVFPPKSLTDSRIPVQYVESAWEPTPQELEWLNQGGQIVLRICGWQVPVALYCEPPCEVDTEPELKV